MFGLALIRKVESGPEAISERNNSDWLFGLSQSEVSKKPRQEGTHKKEFCFLVQLSKIYEISKQTTATCWEGDVYPLSSAQNVLCWSGRWLWFRRWQRVRPVCQAPGDTRQCNSGPSSWPVLCRWLGVSGPLDDQLDLSTGLQWNLENIR